jgi:hypothetical protein
MGTSVVRKQTHEPHALEHALSHLENMCLLVLEGNFTHGKQDEDRLYWQQKLKNIAKPVSLALAECRGPRVFHQHYRHSAANLEQLQPVLTPALDALAFVCERALRQCEEMVGVKGALLIENKTMLERSLRRFLTTHRG